MAEHTHYQENQKRQKEENLNLFILECTTINGHGRSLFYNHLPGKVKAFE